MQDGEEKFRFAYAPNLYVTETYHNILQVGLNILLDLLPFSISPLFLGVRVTFSSV